MLLQVMKSGSASDVTRLDEAVATRDLNIGDSCELPLGQFQFDVCKVFGSPTEVAIFKAMFLSCLCQFLLKKPVRAYLCTWVYIYIYECVYVCVYLFVERGQSEFSFIMCKRELAPVIVPNSIPGNRAKT